MGSNRYFVLDAIRGIAILNMIVYHAVWDLVHLFGWKWFQADASYIWQQSICWTFIFISGFCQSLGRQRLRRGITVLLCGCLVSLVTIIAMPQQPILFGVLTLIGSCMLLMIPLDNIFKRCNPLAGFLTNMALFFITRNINQGFLRFGTWKFLKLPNSWYRNPLTAYLGFPTKIFHSVDYFSLFPWMFLFIAGYFLYRFMQRKNLLDWLGHSRIKAVEWLGRHSLVIYVIHQPIVYFILLGILH